LQSVTDEGSTTDNNITVQSNFGHITAMNQSDSDQYARLTTDGFLELGRANGFRAVVRPILLTDYRIQNLPDETGTLATREFIANTSGISTSYIVTVIQSGTTAPVVDATILNTMSGTISITYNSPGVYDLVNTSPVFTAGKTLVEFTNGLNQSGSMGAVRVSDTVVRIVTRDTTGTSINNLMQAGCTIKITVF
jgi:hypothetical protein